MNNEWIKWEGGECPVDEGTVLDIEHRDGDIYYKAIYGESYACKCWSHEGVDSDIIAYRLHCDYEGCTDGGNEIPEFLKNDFKDNDGLTEHEFDEPGDGILEELAIKDIPPVLRPAVDTLEERVMEIVGNQKFCSMCGAQSLFGEEDTCGECENKFKMVCEDMENNFGIDPEMDEKVDRLVNQASSTDARPLTRRVEDKAVEWDGEGLPPVGIVCEWCDYGDRGEDWKQVEILAIHQGAYWMISGAEYEIDTNPKHFEFRRKKSDKEKAIEEMFEIFMQEVDGDFFSNAESAIEALYEAGYKK